VRPVSVTLVPSAKSAFVARVIDTLRAIKKKRVWGLGFEGLGFRV